MNARRLSLPLLATLLLVVVSSVAHAELLGRRLDYRGLLLPLDHLFTLFAASALFLLCTAAGRKALRAAGVTIDDPVEGIPFAAAIGAAVIGTVLLLAGVVGLLRQWSLALIVGAIIAFSWSEWSGVRSWVRCLPAGLRTHGLSNVAVGLQLLLLFFPLVLALRPPSDWDALMYHLDVPADYLASGRVYLPVDNLHSVFLGPIQLLYVPLLAVAANPYAFFYDALVLAVPATVWWAERERWARVPWVIAGTLIAVVWCSEQWLYSWGVIFATAGLPWLPPVSLVGPAAAIWLVIAAREAMREHVVPVPVEQH